MVNKYLARLTVVAGLVLAAQPSPSSGAVPRLDGHWRDIFGLTTGLASSTFLQGIRGSKRFIVSEKKDSFAGEETREDIPIDVAWQLGYTYLHQIGADNTPASGLADDSHVFDVGLGVDLLRRVAVDAGFTLQKVPVENFSQGILRLDFTYVIPLVSQRHPDDERIQTRDSEGLIDARAEYQQERLRDEAKRLELPPDEVFPQLRVGISAHFSRYRQESSPSSRNAASSLTSAITLEQALAGPEFTYVWSPRLNTRLMLLFGKYSSSVDEFVSYQTMGGSRTPAALGLMTQTELHEFLLLYPRRILHVSADFRLTDAWEVTGFATHLAPQVTGRAPIYSFGGFLQGALSANWRLGAGLDLTMQDNRGTTESWLSFLGRLSYAL